MTQVLDWFGKSSFGGGSFRPVLAHSCAIPCDGPMSDQRNKANTWTGSASRAVLAFVGVGLAVVVQAVAEGLQEPLRPRRAFPPHPLGRFRHAPQVHDPVGFQRRLRQRPRPVRPTPTPQVVEDLHPHVFALGLGDGVGGGLFRVGEDVRDAVDIAIDGRLQRETAARLRRVCPERGRRFLDQAGHGGERRRVVARVVGLPRRRHGLARRLAPRG